MSEGSPMTEVAALDAEIGKSIEAGKGWSEEDRASYLQKVSDEEHPLFAESIEDIDPGVVKAFQDLTYENETPLSLGEHFKKLGNERFARAKNNRLYYRYAEQSYTEGLRNVRLASCSTPELEAVTVALLSNRAATHLALENYGSCRKDCDEALRLSPRHVKCIYRKAKAELMLRRHRESLEACKKGLEVDPGNKEMLKIKEKCEEALKAAEDAAAAVSRGREERLERLAAVWDACESVGVRLGPSAFEESHQEQRNAFLPEADDEGGVTWPVLLLYPQNGQSDIVQAFRHEDMIAEHLARAFPEEGPLAPWDEAFEYRCSELVVYLPVGQVDASRSVFEWVAEFERIEASKLHGDGDDDEDDDGRRHREAQKAAAAAAAAASRPRRWARVHPGCTLLRVLSFDGHVVAGATPTLLVFPTASKAHSDFVRDSAGRVVDLSP